MSCRVLYGKNSVVTCKFGMRTHPVTGIYKLHNGVDVVGEGYTLAHITAHTAGKVEYAGYNSVLGYHVNVRLNDGSMMQYCHMTASLQVKTGDNVAEGQIIGTMGSTGYSTGAHLHFGIQDKSGEWIDPQPFLYEDYLEEEMSYEKFKEYMAQYNAEVAAQPVSDWAEDAWDRLCNEEIFDGTDPKGAITRQEVALVIDRIRKDV